MCRQVMPPVAFPIPFLPWSKLKRQSLLLISFSLCIREMRGGIAVGNLFFQLSSRRRGGREEVINLAVIKAVATCRTLPHIQFFKQPLQKIYGEHLLRKLSIPPLTCKTILLVFFYGVCYSIKNPPLSWIAPRVGEEGSKEGGGKSNCSKQGEETQRGGRRRGWFFPFSPFFHVKLGENRVIGTNGRVSFSHGRIFHIFPNKYYK